MQNVIAFGVLHAETGREMSRHTTFSTALDYAATFSADGQPVEVWWHNDMGIPKVMLATSFDGRNVLNRYGEKAALDEAAQRST